jgi:hypothetical protein
MYLLSGSKRIDIFEDLFCDRYKYSNSKPQKKIGGFAPPIFFWTTSPIGIDPNFFFAEKFFIVGFTIVGL